MARGPTCTDDRYKIHTLTDMEVSERKRVDGVVANTRRTFCDNTSSQASGALGSSTYPICTRDIDHPWPKVAAVDVNGVTA